MATTAPVAHAPLRHPTHAHPVVTTPAPRSQHGLARSLWPLGQASRARLWAGLGPPLIFLLYSIFFSELNFQKNSSRFKIFLENKIKLRKYKINFLGFLFGTYLQ
jgi:hypothetical protein